MTKREKYLGLGLLLIFIVITHVILASCIKRNWSKKNFKLAELQSKIDTYLTVSDSSELLRKEMDWVNQYTPEIKSFQDTQTNLQNFLISSSKDLGFSPFVRSMNTEEEAVKSGEFFNKVLIQISARASEKQIYQWLIKIHQPQEMRILSYLKLSPPTNDSNLINCQIIAEQYIIAK